MKIEEMNLSHLKYFIDTVDCQSMTKAADINFVTRPAISQAIRRLEEWFGKNLITHEKKVFILTKEGQKFYQVGKGALTSFKKSFEHNTFLPNTINMGSSASLVENFLVSSLSRVGTLDNFSLKAGTSSQLKAMLLNREINLAIYIDQHGMKTENNIVLYEGKYVVASGDSKIKEIILVTEDRDEVMALKKYFVKKNTDAHHFFCVESWGLCVKIALALNGGCLVPDFLLSSVLKKVKTDNFTYDYKVILTHRSPEFLSNAEREIIKAISGNAFKRLKT